MRWSLLLLTAVTLAGQPTGHTLEIDNPWVRVYRVKQAPRETAPPHEHPDAVIVALTDVRQRLGGRDLALMAGEVGWVAAGRYAEENLSDRPLELVLVELKPDAPPNPSPPVTLDPVRIDPQYHTVPFENDRVRALRTVLEPRIQSPLHEHPHYVVVYLTELHTTMRMADGRELDNPRRPGDIAWRDALKHETVNIGPRTAVEIQLELK
jgi:quercetin dioxygenase-like cupin family protein